MRRFLSLALVAALSVSAAACGPATTPPPSTAAPPPAVTPLGDTSVDEQAIVIAYQALEVAAATADTLIVTKVITPGSQRAIELANALDGAKTWLNVASAALRAGNATNAAVAFMQAQAALEGAKNALKGAER